MYLQLANLFEMLPFREEIQMSFR